MQVIPNTKKNTVKILFSKEEFAHIKSILSSLQSIEMDAEDTLTEIPPTFSYLSLWTRAKDGSRSKTFNIHHTDDLVQIEHDIIIFEAWIRLASILIAKYRQRIFQSLVCFEENVPESILLNFTADTPTIASC